MNRQRLSPFSIVAVVLLLLPSLPTGFLVEIEREGPLIKTERNEIALARSLARVVSGVIGSTLLVVVVHGIHGREGGRATDRIKYIPCESSRKWDAKRRP